MNTSTGATDVKAWGTDECLLWNTPLLGADLIRAAAAQDLAGPHGGVIPYVWIGGWNGLLWKLDGTTGAQILETQSPATNYGFALDGVGNLWVSGLTALQGLGRIDTTRCIDAASCSAAACAGEG